jgi:hypothetical protein
LPGQKAKGLNLKTDPSLSGERDFNSFIERRANQRLFFGFAPGEKFAFDLLRA